MATLALGSVAPVSVGAVQNFCNGQSKRNAVNEVLKVGFNSAICMLDCLGEWFCNRIWLKIKPTSLYCNKITCHVKFLYYVQL